MNPPQPPGERRYCGRVFSAGEIEMIRGLVAEDPALTRAELSRQVCDALGWRRADGRRKDMACRVALLRMHRDGLVPLPSPRKGNGNGRWCPRLGSASDPGPPLLAPAGALGELRFEPVRTGEDSSLWNEMIARYHYRGYRPLAGAQMRYGVWGAGQLLAALGYGAAAWALAPRDRWIGWTAGQRLRHLPQVVNHARFLILPWIRCRNLASRILAGIARRLPQDWRGRYGYEPVLFETFVERERFTGACYRAANWIHVGHTQGRGKLDRHNLYALPVKDIYLYPLRGDFRQMLCAD